MSRNKRVAHQKAGFALPAVLTTVTILTIIYLTVIVATHDLLKEAVYQKEESRFLLDAMSAEAELAFWVATEPETRNALSIGAPRQSGLTDPAAIEALQGGGIRYLRIDATDYAWRRNADPMAPDLILAIQDDAGLINLNFASQEVRERVFEAAGLDAGAAQVMASQLTDYIDGDDFLSLGGAEFKDYERAGRPPPPNQTLNNPAQLYGLLDWKKNPPPNWDAVASLVTTQYDTASFNINTASAETLALVFGMTERQAEATIARRGSQTFYSVSELGLPDDNERLYTYANGRFRFTVFDSERGFRYTSRLSLIPDNPDRPIWIELESLQRFKSRDNPRPDGLPAFPKPGRASDPSRPDQAP